MGDTSFDVDGAVFGWFDRWLKGNTEAFPASTPKVRYYAMGENKWKASASWPPASVKMQRLYLRSDGRANSLWGNGRLDAAAPEIGRAHVLTPVTNAHLVCRLLLEK